MKHDIASNRMHHACL